MPSSQTYPYLKSNRASTRIFIGHVLVVKSSSYMNEYTQEWKRYRQLWTYLILTFVTFVPSTIGIAVLTQKLFHTEAEFPYVAGLWVGVLLVLYLRICAFHCPRCRKPFFGAMWGLPNHTTS